MYSLPDFEALNLAGENDETIDNVSIGPDLCL